ncbi:aminotransferase class I/II-fold pyridoxal phosphate-dependent enzyme [Pseudaeromonas sharmana]|uniref:8-amino-7-oxononanoate synthase n=1 Tax=Pseudaeromonas sharmana TaxID=328412 RepID=A0ABV8CK68_9GAMM
MRPSRAANNRNWDRFAVTEAPFALLAALQARRDQGLLRTRCCSEHVSGSRMVVAGREHINFSSNDYLGASQNPLIRSAWKAGLDVWGAGSGASPLVTGYTAAHRELEEAIAEWLGVEAVMLFSSGFAANQAVIKSLLTAEHTVWQDRLNHASLQEAGSQHACRLRRFRHNDLAHLSSLLATAQGLIVSEGVFSMDGDQAPCAGLHELAHQSQNWWMLDDAHGLGVLGAQGRGTLDHQGLGSLRPDVLMATFGKALGTSGAFVAGRRELIDYMVNFSRDYVYSTHMPPAQAVATLAAVRWVKQADAARAHLAELIHRFRTGAMQAGLPLLDSATPIQPLLVGCSEQALALATSLRAQGLWVTAIRPPTVPTGTARLRLTLTAGHSVDDIETLVVALARAWQESRHV